ncbi:MAG TPA: DegT/DnrJ/EryC1/StrS family aminotransferase [Kiritimatiellia bacterium]|nr:DegT/DnrJ/EryC1/StrS family aminotransferase [Kiritimatiellia bacterium]
MTELPHASRIWLSCPHMGEDEFAFVKEAFDTNWIAPVGPHLEGFEADLAAYTGMPHVAALASGTAAIHLALILLDVGPDDEVICQSFTFSGSANPIVYQRATPVFVDSEPYTWNMDPQSLREALHARLALGKKVKAIIAVDLYGMPAKWTELKAVAEEFGVPLIEDAAEALGARYRNTPCGQFGTFAILSFNGNKIITTSGGGALLGRDQALIDRARYLATQARDPAPHYQHSTIGYNYRLSNVLAGIGRGQMRVLDERVRQRRAHFDAYQRHLAHLPGVSFPAEPADAFSNRWLTTLLLNPARTSAPPESLRLALEKLNIESRPLWKPMHLQPVFRDAPYYGGNVAETLFHTGLCLPSASKMTEPERNLVIEHIIQHLS